MNYYRLIDYIFGMVDAIGVRPWGIKRVRRRVEEFNSVGQVGENYIAEFEFAVVVHGS